MSSIIEIKKDVTTVTHGMVLHGCNCMGVMGGGVALAIKNKWPDAYEAYRDYCNSAKSRESLLGRVLMVDVSPHSFDGQGVIVANAFTQVAYGSSTPDAVPEAIEKALTEACETVRYIQDVERTTLSNTSFELPLYTVKMGCLRGGLDWETDVRPIYERVSSKFPDVVIFVADI